MTDLKRAAMRGVAWTGLQKWTAKLAALAAFVIVSRQLEPAAFGLVALATSLTAVMTIIVEAGTKDYLVQRRELTRDTTATAFWTSLVVSAILAGVLGAVAIPVAGAFGEPLLPPVIQALSVLLVLSALSAVPMALLSRQLRFRALAIREILSATVSAFVGVTLALIGAGVWALVAQAISQALISVITLWIATKWVPRGRWRIREVRPMISYGAKIMGAQFVFVARTRGVELIIGALLSTTALGIWVIAQRLLQTLLDLFTSALSVVALPSFARMRDDRPGLYRAYGRGMSLIYFAFSPVLVALAAYSPQIIPFAFGTHWEAAIEPAQWLALGAVVTTGIYLDRPMLLAVGKPSGELVLGLILAVLHVATVVFFAPLGLVSLAIAVSVRSILTWPIRMLFMRRVAGVPVAAYRQLPPIGVAAAGMALVCFGALALPVTPQAAVGIGVALGVAVYFSLARLLAPSLWHNTVSDVRSLVSGP